MKKKTIKPFPKRYIITYQFLGKEHCTKINADSKNDAEGKFNSCLNKNGKKMILSCVKE